MCAHTYIHTCIHTYIHACMHACMHAYIHTYMHACMHTYMHTACTRPAGNHVEAETYFHIISLLTCRGFSTPQIKFLDEQVFAFCVNCSVVTLYV